MKDNQFDIPSHNLKWATKKIEKINKKAKKLGFDSFNLNIIKEYQAERTSETGYTYTYKRCIVEIDNPNKMVIGGWKLLAHTEYLNNSNIISRIDLGDNTNLNDYRNKIECNHCGINHKRKYTYILKNDSNELKQVGTACVKDFTGHDPKRILRLAEMFTDIKESFSEEEDHMVGTAVNGFYLVEYLAKTINYLKNGKHPYISKTKAHENYTTSTASIINFSYDHLVAEEDKIIPDKKDFLSAKKIINYFRNYKKIRKAANGTAKMSDYHHNLINIISNDYIEWKFDGYITSMYSSYLREKLKTVNLIAKKMTNKSMWIKNIGDKIEKNVKLTFRTVFETAYGLTYLYKFTDENDNTLIWVTGINIDNSNADTQLTIKGTIKKHNEYKGEKQTVLTRCKLSLL